MKNYYPALAIAFRVLFLVLVAFPFPAQAEVAALGQIVGMVKLRETLIKCSSEKKLEPRRTRRFTEEKKNIIRVL